MPRAAKKKETKFDGAGAIRDTALRGISNPVAIALYDESMRTLGERGEATYMAALQLRDACAWTEVIEDVAKQLRKAAASGGATETQLRAMMRNKAVAENARTKILDSLLLIPQRPRGRPRGENGSEEPERDDAADAWASFDDKTVCADGFEDGDGS